MLTLLALHAMTQAQPRWDSNGLHGYINASIQNPPAEYGYGVSLYSSAWPLIAERVRGFQIGLASTWILPDNRSIKEPLVPVGTVARDSMPERGPSFWTVFQTIEGGLGFWVSNRFSAPTAKFRMNGSVDGYNHEVATSGWDFYGRPLTGEYMGIAQLSSRLLIPPDGVTLKPDTCGEVFGYAWMALPLISARDKPVKTGNQCWTAFLNTANFRGPIAFYLPSAWSKMSQRHAPAVGRGLDALPGLANSGAIEIGSVPQFVGEQSGDSHYTRIPQLQFPADKDGRTLLFHNMTVYSKKALWDQVASWMGGGAMPGGHFDGKGAFMPTVKANPIEVTQGTNAKAKGVGKWVKTVNVDDYTFGLEWEKERMKPWNKDFRMASFPAYFHHTAGGVEAIEDAAVPAGTGLAKAQFPKPNLNQSYVPSEDGKGVWMTPGPKSGPHQVRLSDNSVVTYYWYRFIDQPAMQNAGLTDDEKRRLQAVVERMHRSWTPDKQYMDPPKRGKLAQLESVLLVKPPKGMEVGYVPVAMRQDPAK